MHLCTYLTTKLLSDVSKKIFQIDYWNRAGKILNWWIKELYYNVATWTSIHLINARSLMFVLVNMNIYIKCVCVYVLRKREIPRSLHNTVQECHLLDLEHLVTIFYNAPSFIGAISMVNIVHCQFSLYFIIHI